MSLRRAVFPKGTGRDRFWAAYLRPGLLRALGHGRLPPAAVAGVGVSRSAGEDRAIRSILILKPDHVGDFLLALPAFALIRRSFPDADITLLCGPWNEAAARHAGAFDRVVTVSVMAPSAAQRAASLERLGIGAFDLAVDLRVDEDSRHLLGHLRARYKAGFASVLMPDDMTLVLPQPPHQDMGAAYLQHDRALMLQLAGAVAARFAAADESVAALERMVAAAGDPWALLPGRVKGPLIVVAPFSGRSIKNWPAARFAAVIVWMVRELGATVVLVGREDERGEAAALERLTAGLGVHNLVGGTRLEEAFALVALADVFLGNDSGLAHAAALLRRPTVALYAGVAPVERWQPLGPDVTVLRTEVACAPCGLRHLTDCVHGHACMDAIPVGTVQAAVQAALRPAAERVARAEVLAVGP